MRYALVRLEQAARSKDLWKVWACIAIINRHGGVQINQDAQVMRKLLSVGRADAVAQAAIPAAYEATEVLAKSIRRPIDVAHMAVDMSQVVEFLKETARG
jgi:hypothetical protein